MKLLLKILFFVLAIFQTNICEAKVIEFENILSETIISNAVKSEKINVELKIYFQKMEYLILANVREI